MRRVQVLLELRLVLTRVHVFEHQLLNQSRLALRHPILVCQQLREVERKLLALLHEIFQRGHEQLLDVALLSLVFGAVNVFLQVVSKLYDFSELNSEFADRLVVVVDSPSFVTFHHSSEMRMQELQLAVHFLLPFVLAHFLFGLVGRLSSLERKPWLLGHYLFL